MRPFFVLRLRTFVIGLLVLGVLAGSSIVLSPGAVAANTQTGICYATKGTKPEQDESKPLLLSAAKVDQIDSWTNNSTEEKTHKFTEWVGSGFSMEYHAKTVTVKPNTTYRMYWMSINGLKNRQACRG